MLYDDISQTIGRTPVVRINRLAPAHVTLYVKLEAANPGGSVKDRLALGIIQDAERRGLLEPGQTVVEATSGNTGIALALVCAARGYPFVAVMPESFSVERRQIMRAYGAKVVLTPAAERASGAVTLAARLAEERGWFLARQFDNEANPAFHRQTTGPEILSDFASSRLDYLVTRLGHRRHAHRRRAGDQAARVRRRRSSRASPRARRCSAAGVEAAQDPGLDARLHAHACSTVTVVRRGDRGDRRRGASPRARELGRREGIFCGISGGRDVRRCARRSPPRRRRGSVILAMLPDTGERYLSTVLFEGVETGSDTI